MVLYILGEWLKAKDKDGNQRLHKNKVIRLNGDAQRVSTILNHMILGHYVYLSGKDMMETEPASFEAEVANAFKTICQQFLKPVIPFTAFKWLREEMMKKENQNMTKEQQIDLNVKFFAKREDNPNDYGGRLTKSNVDTIFYIAQIGHIQASNFETSMIKYEAAGFLLGNSTFKPYKIILTQIENQKRVFDNFGFVMEHIPEITERVYEEWNARHPDKK